MLLSKRTIISANKEQDVIFEHLGYAAYKLWNVANYEKRNYKDLGFAEFPNWYEQKKRLKNNFFYKNLPSQTAQELLNQLQQSWNSFFVLKKTGGIENPKPPRFKKSETGFCYLKDAIEKKGEMIRLSIPAQLKGYLSEQGLDTKYINLKIESFSDIQTIKQIKIKNLKKSKYEIIVIYEINDAPKLEDNNHYLSIDIGVNNLLTCYDSAGGGFIISGNRYLNSNYYYSKHIAHLQSIYDMQQDTKYPKKSEKVLSLYKKKANITNDILHKSTKYITDYCIKNQINAVVIGDIKNIRKDKNLGRNNQNFHALPFARIYQKLEYKLSLAGIAIIKQKENYSSQCSPYSLLVNKANANKSNRKNRGLYKDGNLIFNADMVGAFNILRLYFQSIKKELPLPIVGLSSPIKVTV